MSDAVVGLRGKVTFSGTEITEIQKWSITPTGKEINTSSMSSGGNYEYKMGMKGWSGSFDTIKYLNLHGSTAIGSFFVGSVASTNEPVYHGTVLITSIPITTDYDDKVVWSHSFQGSGALTIAVS
jgi:predicted secreted protein